LTGITNAQINDYKQKFSDSELKKLGEAAVEISQCPIYLCEQTGLTAYQIRALARQHQKKYGLDLLIVDYIQQIADNFKAETRNLEVTRQIRALKDLAKELNIAVLAVSQINREFNQLNFNPLKKQYGFPKLSHLRDSGTIEQEANVVLFVWNLVQAARDKNMADNKSIWTNEQLMAIESGAEPSFIAVAKNKIGKKSLVPCLWRGEQMRFFSEIKNG
jgi:replicative DNA helicase